ncbi:PAS domain S-box protein [Candidatus Fermentibacteria bacterium]|nr:PAS domain S-box protein [Candidatus Fermentibacteria bacterium]
MRAQTGPFGRRVHKMRGELSPTSARSTHPGMGDLRGDQDGALPVQRFSQRFHGRVPHTIGRRQVKDLEFLGIGPEADDRIGLEELAAALAESTGIGAARRLLREKIESSGLEQKDSYSSGEIGRICSELAGEGGLVRLVAESFLSHVEDGELKRIEKALWRSEEMLANLIETVPDAMYFKDSRGRHILVNGSFEALVGRSRDQVVGRTDSEVLPAGMAESNSEIDGRVLGEGRSLRHEGEIELEDGTTRFFEAVKTPVKDPGGEIVGVLGIMRDSTERKRSTDELLKAVKLESVGLLAGGIAHDFNNLLTAILGNVSLALLKLDQGQDVRKLLQEIRKATDRTKDLTQQLLTFSQGGAPVKKKVSLEKTIRDSAAFATTGSSVECSFEVDEDLELVECDTGQISQVVNSLVLNAIQAMPDGGTVEVETSNVSVKDSRTEQAGLDTGEEEALYLPLSPGRYVRFVVRDKGGGIPEEHLDRVFDPYFTTKKGGSGLGLASSYNIVRQHGGHMEVESTPGSGSAFSVYLPAVSRQRTLRARGRLAETAGSARILVMDDQKMVLEVAKEMLSFLGHSVICALDGAEALRLYGEALDSGNRFDLVVMDLTVPGGMGGVETVRQLKEMDPKARAVVSSGYSNNPVMANYADYGFDGVVPKPYHVDQMKVVLDNVLAKE